MIAVIQRVKEASVEINDSVNATIKNGLLVYIGIEEADDNSDIEWISRKIINMRLFSDDNGIMNKSVKEIDGEILLVSQFTLHASTKKGNRPSFMKAAKPAISLPLYNDLILSLNQELGKSISTGEFGADMQVKSINDGPVTIIIDTKNKN